MHLSVSYTPYRLTSLKTRSEGLERRRPPRRALQLLAHLGEVYNAGGGREKEWEWEWEWEGEERLVGEMFEMVVAMWKEDPEDVDDVSYK